MDNGCMDRQAVVLGRLISVRFGLVQTPATFPEVRDSMTFGP